MVTMSEREGLFDPVLCALIVRNVSIVAVGGTAVGGIVGPVVTGSPCGMVRMSVCVGSAGGRPLSGPCLAGLISRKVWAVDRQ